MLAIFCLLYILFGSHLTIKSIIVIDALKQKGLIINKISLFLWAIIMPFVLPLAYGTGMFINLKGIKK